LCLLEPIFFSADPLATTDTTLFNDLVSFIYPDSVVVSGYQWKPLQPLSPPSFIDMSVRTNLWFIGNSIAKSTTAVAVVLGTIQAGLTIGFTYDVRSDYTLCGYTTVLHEGDDLDPTGWDPTMTFPIERMMNRAMLTNITIAMLPSLTPVFYATSEDDYSSYANFYREYGSFEGDSVVSLFSQNVNWWTSTGHQRSGDGSTTSLSLTWMCVQGRGGGFIAGALDMFKEGLTLVGNIGTAINRSGLLKGKSDRDVLNHIANNPLKYGHSTALQVQRVMARRRL